MNKFKTIFLSLLLVLLLLVGCSPSPSQTTPNPAAPTNTPVSTPSIPTIAPTPTTTSSPAILSANETLIVHFIDVGQGDSILIDLEQTEILIDGGEKNTGVADYIRPYVDGALEAMVATHPHADHIGGLLEVLQKYDIKDIWLNGDTYSTKTYTDFMNLVNAENATVHEAERGQTMQVGVLNFNILNPAKPLSTDTNDNSIVLSLSYGDTDFLFMGDAQRHAESSMLNLVTDIDILKVGHHGSRTSSSPEFLNLIKPEVAIYSARLGNSYGHPHQETLVALNSIGAKIYGTEVHGTVEVTTNGKVYDVRPEKQLPPVKSSSVSPSPTLTPTPTPAPSPSSTPSSTPTPSTVTNVKITKVFYDGLVPRTESDEYVEITNLGNEPVDLKGWVVKDISEGYPVLTFPSYILQPGKSLRVYTNEIHPEYGGFSFGSGKAVWNNTSPDTAALFNAQGQEVSRKSY